MMAAKADLVGAIRLPDTAFKENARTEVVTDIIVMGRRDPVEQKQIQDLINAAHQSGKEDVENRRKAQEELDRDVPWIGTSEVPDPLGGEPMRATRRSREGACPSSGAWNARARCTAASNSTLNSTATISTRAWTTRPVLSSTAAPGSWHSKCTRSPMTCSPRRPSVTTPCRTPSRSRSQATSRGTSSSTKREKLTQIAERETLTGGYELRRRLVMPNAKREDIEALVA